MAARWVFSSLGDLDPRSLGYYLSPCMLRTIWRVGCLYQTLIAISTLLQLPWPGVFCISVSIWGFPGHTMAKNSPASAGDVRDSRLIPELEDPPGGEHGSPLQYPSLENSVDRRAWQSLGLQRFGHDWGCTYQEFYMISSPKVPSCFRSQT